MSKIIIAGGRDFENYQMLKEKCDVVLRVNELGAKWVREQLFPIILSGKSRGADVLGEKYALERGFEIREFPALWDDLSHSDAKIKKNAFGNMYDSLAGFRRNSQMVDVADTLILFWDGKSSGTQDTLKKAIDKRIEIHVYFYTPDKKVAFKTNVI